MVYRAITLPFLMILAFISLTSMSHATKVYHWVDEQGRSHFSENPPRDADAKKLNIKPAGAGSSAATSESGSSSANTQKNKQSSDSEEPTSMTKLSAADKAKYCQQSRNLLQQVSGNVQRRFEQPDGSYRKLTESEISKYKMQAQEGIKNYCL